MQAESATGSGSVLLSPEIGPPLLPMTIYLAKLLLPSSPVPLEVLLTMFFTGSTPGDRYTGAQAAPTNSQLIAQCFLTTVG